MVKVLEAVFQNDLALDETIALGVVSILEKFEKLEGTWVEFMSTEEHITKIISLYSKVFSFLDSEGSGRRLR